MQKPLFIIAAFAAALSQSAVRSHADSLQPNDVIAICGDSITEQKLYSLFMEDYFLMCQPSPNLKAHQFGWSGETAHGFLARMKHSVLPFKPTVATTCYGMNDGGYSAIDPARQKKYRESMEGIVKTFKEAGVRFIVVGSPGAVDTTTYDAKGGKKANAAEYNKTLGDLTQIAKEVAASQGVAFADVHTPMLEVMAKAKAKYGPNYHLGGSDGVHPASNGHLVMAYAFLKALGCSGDIGTITFDGASGSATATDGHRVVSANKTEVEVESTRYPFCFGGKPDSPSSTASVADLLPFNEELNRFRLIVKNPPAPKVQIKWGKQSKIFPADQLAQGINLAAEFLENPFSEPFLAAEKVIRQKQEFETTGIKGILSSTPNWAKLMPEDAAAIQALEEAVVRRANALADQARAAVVPVQHTIEITPAPGALPP